MMKKLEENTFSYDYEHIQVEGGHAAFTKQYDVIFPFLSKILGTEAF